MSGAGKNKPEGLLGLTQGEARLILLGVLFSDASGKIDFDKLAANAHYKNVASASSSYRQAKKRFTTLNNVGTGSSETATPNTTPAKATATKRKRAPAAIDPDTANNAANDNADGAAENEDVASPTTKPKPKRQRKATPKKDITVEIETFPVKMETESDQSELSSIPPSPLSDLNSEASSEPEPKQQDPISNNDQANPNTIITTKSKQIPANTNLRSEEEEVMTDLDVDAEFAAMEKDHKLTGA
ncbi:putative histone h1.3 [Aspergillus stella-maris]|uniref:putative histone h1.3 n=1 Tax=Aspergillus stella-maris TaxID=1810926 RepID=UPI003CCE53A8